jgi:hypothetical protein
VAGDNDDLVGEGEEAVVDGGEELVGVAAGEVSAADGAGEKGVSGEEQGLVGKVETDAALGVAGGMEDGAAEAGDGDELAVIEGVVGGGGDFGGGDAEPTGLDVHHFDQGKIVLVVQDGGSGKALEALGSGDVVDVGVGDDDLLDGEVVFVEDGDDARDLVAGVDDDGFEGDLVAQDGAVALQGADGEDFMNHGFKTKGLERSLPMLSRENC